MSNASRFSQAIVSSRVRLARNMEGRVFVHRMSLEAIEDWLLELEKLLESGDLSEKNGPLSFMRMEAIDKEARGLLLEKHLISPKFFAIPKQRALILNQKDTLSVMVNEEDHLRIQGFAKGYDLESSYLLARHFDEAIEGHMNYVTDADLGYLSSCPTNVGTGMRASLMIFLPVLSTQSQFKKMVQHLSGKGYSLRGFYGEGTSGQGCLYQLSNQATLGLAEEEIMEGVEQEARRLILQEWDIIDHWDEEMQEKYYDQAYKAYGRLRYARTMGIEESITTLSDLRLAQMLELDLPIEQDISVYNRLIYDIQPGHLGQLVGENRLGRTRARKDLLKQSLLLDRKE